MSRTSPELPGHGQAGAAALVERVCQRDGDDDLRVLDARQLSWGPDATADHLDQCVGPSGGGRAGVGSAVRSLDRGGQRLHGGVDDRGALGVQGQLVTRHPGRAVASVHRTGEPAPLLVTLEVLRRCHEGGGVLDGTPQLSGAQAAAAVVVRRGRHQGGYVRRERVGVGERLHVTLEPGDQVRLDQRHDAGTERNGTPRGPIAPGRKRTPR